MTQSDQHLPENSSDYELAIVIIMVNYVRFMITMPISILIESPYLDHILDGHFKLNVEVTFSCNVHNA